MKSPTLFGRLLTVLVLCCCFLATSAHPPAHAAAQWISGTALDGRPYQLYIPSGYDENTPVPLVVMLHGCTQTPDTFAAETEMNALGEQHTFLVLYPEQTFSSNISKCWNWFDPNHQARGKGEPASIANLVNTIQSRYAIDEQRVYVAGLSAGGAMSVIMGATYPDLFAAIGISAGLEYKAATSLVTANMAMLYGGPHPDQQGTLAYQAMGNAKRVVPVILFHGTADYRVAPINGDQILSQWAQTNDLAADGKDDQSLDDIADITHNGQVPNGRAYTEYLYRDTTGKTILSKVIVNGMGHAWSGGSSTGAYTDPKGPKASQMMWQFFINHAR